jgi:hypothetical protein
MILEATSRLLHLPENTDRRQVLFLDGLRYTAEMAVVGMHRLRANLPYLFTHREDRQARRVYLTAAIADAWSIVDNAHRMRELLQRMPRLKQRSPARVIFLQRTERVEAFRNYFQHLRTEVDRVANIAWPLYGTLTWRSPVADIPLAERGFMVVPGTFYDNITSIGPTFGYEVTEPYAELALNLPDMELQLQPVVDAMTRALIAMERSTATQIPDEHATGRCDLFVRMTLLRSTESRDRGQFELLFDPSE